MMVSDVHNVCKKGFYVCILSTNVETNHPEKELDPGFELVGNVLEKFFTVFQLYILRFPICMSPLMMVQKATSIYQVHSTQHHILSQRPYKS